MNNSSINPIFLNGISVEPASLNYNYVYRGNPLKESINLSDSLDSEINR